MGRDGLPVVDMCAAPGGKTARLAAAWGQGHPVLAWDNRPRRIELLRDTLARTELLATVQRDLTAEVAAARLRNLPRTHYLEEQ